MSSSEATSPFTDPRDDGDSWREWYRLTPLQRWHESMKLWQFYLKVGGSLDPEPDPQSPFDAFLPRDKDWPMIRRLVDAHYDEFQSEPNEGRVRFWLRESRTPEVLIRVGAENVDILREQAKARPLLAEAMAANTDAIHQELEREQAREKEADQAYWNPLKRELEKL